MSYTATPNQTSRSKPGSEKSSFAQNVEDKASDLAEGAADTASAALEKGKQLAEVAGHQAKEASKMLAERIKENPLSAIGIAFGVGVLFALVRK